MHESNLLNLMSSITWIKNLFKYFDRFKNDFVPIFKKSVAKVNNYLANFKESN